MRNLILYITVVFAVFFTVGCKHNKVLKSTDLTYKYEMTNKYFDEGEYYRAMPLLEELIPIYRGTEKAERLFYIYAFCEYYLKDYILAAHRFNTFVNNFPFSKHTEECQFMSAICHYKMSPKFSLDQTDTYTAIDQLGVFARQFPESQFVDSSYVMMDELREKLEKKSFMVSKQYYRTGRYKAAVTSFNNTLIDYPDTEYREESLFLMVKAYFEWAENSIDTKKEERYANTKKAYFKFAAAYPESKFLKEAKEVIEETEEELAKITEKKT